MRLKTPTAITGDALVAEIIARNGFAARVADGAEGDAELTLEIADPGRYWYVDTANGSDTNNGRSWDAPFLTMNKAFLSLASSDTVFFRGKVKEQLTTPVQVFDVTVVGASNRPRHADSTPSGGQSGASWQLPDTPTTVPLVKVLQQGWRFVNVLFVGPTDAAAVQLFRDGGAGNAERDASHAEFVNCRFASGKNAIEDSGGCYNVGVFDCDFHDLTDYVIVSTVGAGIGLCYRWQVKRNRFMDCAKWIDYPGSGKEWEIQDNTVVKITTPGIDTSGGAGGNVVTGNKFDIAAADFDPVGGFTADATDVWSNTLLDAIETGVPAN